MKAAGAKPEERLKYELEAQSYFEQMLWKAPDIAISVLEIAIPVIPPGTLRRALEVTPDIYDLALVLYDLLLDIPEAEASTGGSGLSETIARTVNVLRLLLRNRRAEFDAETIRIQERIDGPRDTRIINKHLAGKPHPDTGIMFDKDGFPNFSPVTKREVKIEFTGSRNSDFKKANEAVGLNDTPEGFTWHHHQDGKTMQLVPEDIHRKTGHTGGFAISR